MDRAGAFNMLRLLAYIQDRHYLLILSRRVQKLIRTKTETHQGLDGEAENVGWLVGMGRVKSSRSILPATNNEYKLGGLAIYIE